MKPNRHPITGAPATTRSEMGDWLTSHPGWHQTEKPFTLPLPKSPAAKNRRIRELEQENRRLRRQIEQDRIDRVLTDPKTGRPRDLICRTL